MSGHLPEICQHPSPQCPEFLLALEDYCLTHSGDHSVPAPGQCPGHCTLLAISRTGQSSTGMTP